MRRCCSGHWTAGPGILVVVVHPKFEGQHITDHFCTCKEKACSLLAVTSEANERGRIQITLVSRCRSFTFWRSWKKKESDTNLSFIGNIFTQKTKCCTLQISTYNFSCILVFWFSVGADLSFSQTILGNQPSAQSSCELSMLPRNLLNISWLRMIIAQGKLARRLHHLIKTQWKHDFRTAMKKSFLRVEFNSYMLLQLHEILLCSIWIFCILVFFFKISHSGQWETNAIWLFMLCDTITASSRFAKNIHKRDQQNFMTFLYNCETNK